MKKLILIATLFLSLLCVVSAHANWDVMVLQFIPMDSENVVQSSRGAQVSYIFPETGFYPYLSCEVVPIRPGGQSGADINIASVGFGFERTILDRLKVFCQVGWYEPFWDKNDEALMLWQDDLAEGWWIYTNNKITTANIMWDAYSYEISGGLGGMLGAKFVQPLYKNIGFIDSINFNLIGALRYLVLEEMIKGFNVPFDGGWWEISQDRNFTALAFGFSFDILF